MKIKFSTIIFFILISCSNSNEVELTCSYQAYACGDCFPQFKIDSIFYNSNSKIKIGDEIRIIYNDKELEEWVGNCLICYNYRVKGKIYKPFWRNYYVLVAENYNVKEKFKGCCDESND